MCWRPGPSFCVNTPSESRPRVTILFVSEQPRCCQETGVCIQATDLGPDSPSVVPRGRPRREGGMCLPALSHSPCALGKHVSPSLPQESGQAESRIPAGRTPALQRCAVGQLLKPSTHGAQEEPLWSRCGPAAKPAASPCLPQVPGPCDVKRSPPVGLPRTVVGMCTSVLGLLPSCVEWECQSRDPP